MLRFTFILALLAVGASAQSYALQSSYTVQGTLLGPQGGGVSGLSVQLLDGNGALMEQTVSGDTGEFSFTYVYTSVEGGDELPSALALHPGYPNPFTGQTRFGADIPEAAAYTVSVYNVLGQRVATGTHHLNAGTHAFNLGFSGATQTLFYVIEGSGSRAVAKAMHVSGGGVGSGRVHLSYGGSGFDMHRMATLSGQQLTVFVPQTEQYQSAEVSIPAGQNVSALDIQLRLNGESYLLTGRVRNTRQQSLQGKTVELYDAHNTLLETTTTNAVGRYTFETISPTNTFELRILAQGFYEPFAEALTLQPGENEVDITLEVILQENAFTLHAKTVNFDVETTDFIIRYLNEAGTDSSEVVLTPNESGEIYVNFFNWPGEDARLYNSSNDDLPQLEQLSEIMMLRKTDQIPLELNVSQNPGGGGLYVPLSVANSLGTLNLLTIPKFDTYESRQQQQTVALNVQDYIHKLITTRASSFPNGTVPWAPEVKEDGSLESINIRVVAYNLTTGNPTFPHILEDNIHVMEQVASIYHLNDGTLLYPYTTGVLHTQEEVNEFIQEAGINNSVFITNINGQPGNGIQYIQKNIGSQGYWFINSANSQTSGASVGTTMNEVFESLTSSSDVIGGLDSITEPYGISNLGKTGFRAIQYLDPQTMILPTNQESAQLSSDKYKNVSDAVILEETDYK